MQTTASETQTLIKAAWLDAQYELKQRIDSTVGAQLEVHLAASDYVAQRLAEIAADQPQFILKLLTDSLNLMPIFTEDQIARGEMATHRMIAEMLLPAVQRHPVVKEAMAENMRALTALMIRSNLDRGIALPGEFAAATEPGNN